MKMILKLAGVGMIFLLMLSQCVNDNLVDLTPKTTTLKDTTATTSSATSSSSSSSSTSSSTTTASTSTSGSGNTTSTASSTISFATNIQPILAKYGCSGCHGSSYYNYSGVKSLATSGRLYGTMSGTSGYRLMPPGQGATSAELALIKAWIAEGEPNN